MNPQEPPQNPVGEAPKPGPYSAGVRAELTASLKSAPAALREAVAGLDAAQLATPYKNWTIRQIVNHLGDSHLNAYIRFKWAMTESTPKIKAYEEADWVQLADEASGDLEPALAFLDGLHGKWVQTIEAMTEEQFQCAFAHPQTGSTMTLWDCLTYYPWHGRHHTGQILWLREHNGW